MHETVNQEVNGTAAAQQEPRTFTQDEVNAIVADRLTRERAKYADYDDLKGKAGRADEADSRAAALQQQLDAMKADSDRREMKQRVSTATGVPAALLTRRDRGSLHRPGTGDLEVFRACLPQCKGRWHRWRYWEYPYSTAPHNGFVARV